MSMLVVSIVLMIIRYFLQRKWQPQRYLLHRLRVRNALWDGTGKLRGRVRMMKTLHISLTNSNNSFK